MHNKVTACTCCGLSPHLSESDVVVLADVQSSAELLGLHEQLHTLLVLTVIQEEVSCSTHSTGSALSI